jgi:rare lipoprotein A
MTYRLIGLLALIALMTACSGRGPRYYQDDGPNDNVQFDASRIKDAVPHSEALATSGNRPYIVFGRRYAPMQSATGYKEIGVASWYGKKFHGRLTSSGETYDMYAMSAAHKTLPLPSYVNVRNLANGQQVVVRVNDRGPFLHGRLIDLSYAAAYKLGVLKSGTARVEVTAVGPGHVATNTVALGSIDTPPAVSGEPLADSTHTTAAPDNPVPATAVTTASTKAATGKIFLQVGSFSSWDNAIKLRDRLEAKNIKPVTIATVRVGNARYFRVRVGPVENQGAADSISKQVSALGIPDSRIVNE